MTNWYADALKRSGEIQNGCLPPKVGMSAQEFSKIIGNYTSAQLHSFNPEVMDMLTECAVPYHILGFTKDHQVAYYGLNHVSAKPSNELLDILNEFLEDSSDRSKRTFIIAKSELVDLLSRTN